MNITLTGNNFYQLNKRLKELEKKYVDRFGSLGIERFDGENVESDILLEAFAGNSLFSENRLFIIRDLSLNKPAAENIEQIISSTNEATQLIFVEPQIDKRSSCFKVLKRLTELEEYKQLDAPELTTWLVGEAKNQDANLTFSDAKFLVERAGEDQSLLANELAKLITYSSDITRESIDKLVVENPQSKVFDLLDAAFGGNKEKALRLYKEQRAQKVEPQEILAMLTWQLRLVALAKLGGSRPAASIASDTGMNSFPISKAQNLATRITDKKIKNLAREAVRIDQLLKTKPVEADEAIKTYIATF